MKINPEKFSKSRVIVIAIIAAALITTGIAYGIVKNNDSTPTETRDGVDEQTDNPLKQGNLKENLPVDPSGETQNPDPPTVDPTFSITITDFKQANGQVVIFSVVDAPSAGTCRFTLTTQDAVPVIRENKSTGSDGPKYCNVNIPEAEFEKIGVWKLTVGFTSEGKQNEVSQDVTIN